MSDSEVIKSFLVSLGFKSDEVSQKKFANGVAWATARVQLFVKALETAARVVYNTGKEFVRGMENLFFASQRTHSSVENIKALERTAADFGATAQESLGSLEGLASFLRNTPGGEGFLRSLGVQTRNAKGELRDTTEMLIDVGRQLRRMDFAHANAYAGVLGIDEHTLLALRNGEFEAQFRKAQDKLNKGGFTKAAADAHEFMGKVRELGESFEVLGVRIEAQLLRRVGPMLDRFLAWLDANGPRIADNIAKVVEKLFTIIDKVAPIIGKLVDWFSKLDDATGGWASTVAVLLGVFKLLGGSITGMISGVAGLTASMARLGAVGASAGAGYAVGTAIYGQIEETSFADKIGAAISKSLGFLGSDTAKENSLRAQGYVTGVDGKMYKPGGASVSQKTDIHVYGSDAQTAGANVAREQERVNQRLVRNVKGAVQ